MKDLQLKDFFNTHSLFHSSTSVEGRKRPIQSHSAICQGDSKRNRLLAAVVCKRSFLALFFGGLSPPVSSRQKMVSPHTF
jgi:hypothetical protein